mmetsp:Transcript_46847/g.111483  ORF Transcript_46847/g.111483 Transcript_46847/m.111483 type:complete len:233 (-) Transcript_46847:56-754(-)
MLEPQKQPQLQLRQACALRGIFVALCFAAIGVNVGLSEEAPAAAADAEDAEAPVPVDSVAVMLACKRAIWKKWSSATAFEEIGALVNETIDKSRPDLDGEPTLNYSEATRVLAERQLASCARMATAADVEADKAPGGLAETAVERLLGGVAKEFNLTDADREAFSDAFRQERVDTDAPELLGIQVHRVPWWLQIIYIVAVLAAVCYVVYLVVIRLTSKDKEKAKKQQEKKKS